jgi:hypothetical protein
VDYLRSPGIGSESDLFSTGFSGTNMKRIPGISDEDLRENIYLLKTIHSFTAYALSRAYVIILVWIVLGLVWLFAR